LKKKMYFLSAEISGKLSIQAGYHDC